MDKEPKTHRWLPRFTIRELLLAMVAVGAVVALFAQRQPFGRHKMLQSLDPYSTVVKICSDVGVKVQNTSSQQASGVVFGGGYCVESDSEYSELGYADATTKVMPKLLGHIRDAIESDDGEIVGSGISGSTDESVVSRFSLQYRRGQIRGVARAYAFELPEGGTRILVLMDEY
ncbi:hypothetical protein [Aeoliella sp.]|uniref:hypothetical protein n=1 Tax=Aeoliella sp. TaxID=2795800 RepID=UPI003CCBF064